MKIKTPGTGDAPLICAPLVGKTADDILAELSVILPQKPDMLEWRADFFQAIGDRQSVISMAKTIKSKTVNIPLIFTIRSPEEGGEAICLTPQQKIALNAEICSSTETEYIDCELANTSEHITFLRQVAHANSKKIIASFHQYSYTPEQEILCQKILKAEDYGLDIAKIAVMPHDMRDVLVLLSSLLSAGEKVKIPIIALAMGPYGLISRLAGGIFGSAVTFAAGYKPSAPGQSNIDDLRLVLNVIRKNMNE